MHRKTRTMGIQPICCTLGCSYKFIATDQNLIIPFLVGNFECADMLYLQFLFSRRYDSISELICLKLKITLPAQCLISVSNFTITIRMFIRNCRPLPFCVLFVPISSNLNPYLAKNVIPIYNFKNKVNIFEKDMQFSSTT